MRTAVGSPGNPPAADSFSGTPTHVDGRTIDLASHQFDESMQKLKGACW
jgi:hypothetical protein